MVAPDAVRIPRDVLARYRRVSLYNSPYASHDRGHAIDLYPDAAFSDAEFGPAVRPGAPGAPSPVAGEVRDVRSVSAPSRPGAEDRDHLILLDLEGGVEVGDGIEDPVARILHVDPTVEPGEWVAVGDDLGRTVASGFFAPWVRDHLHLGVRPADRDLHRATGSVPVELGVDPRPVEWDGRGRVVERGETYVVLDRPQGNEGDELAGIGAGGGVLDGGLPHYEGGGVIGGSREGGGPTAVELLGTRVGTARGRTVEWDDPTVLADGDPVHGLSLSLGFDDRGAKLVCPDREFAVREEVRVRIE